MKSQQVNLRIAAAFCTAIGLWDTLYLLSHLVKPRMTAPFPDFLVFYAALDAWTEGKLALVYNIDAFTQFQNVIYADLLTRVANFRPFLYPPTWLLMLLPLAWLSVAKAYAVFMATTVAAATWLEGRRHWRGWLAILVSPAAAWTVLAGQNTFLSIALFYGGLHLLERAPASAGILFGLLAYKPQLWVLVPLALIAARKWRAFAWMTATVIVLALASASVFGIAFWHGFFALVREAGKAQVANEMYEHVFMLMTTLFNAARIVGLSTSAASAIQLAGSALAVAAVWIAFSRHLPGAPRAAVLATATMLVSPYSLNYDLLLLMPAIAALFRIGVVAGFYPAERTIYFILWLMPTIILVLNQISLPIAPLVILSFGGIAWLRLETMSKASSLMRFTA
ncbi:MAG: DUF2029 domain-containing protein [Proteobacteria bacterium]|nr:DUF2029 domain-containing protein [Pseudomonadota bacterium]